MKKDAEDIFVAAANMKKDLEMVDYDFGEEKLQSCLDHFNVSLGEMVGVISD